MYTAPYYVVYVSYEGGLVLLHYPTVYFLFFSWCGGDLGLIWHWFHTTPLSGGAGSRGKGKFQPSRGKQLSTNRKSRGRGKTVGFN